MRVGWAQVHAWRLRRQFVEPRGAVPVTEVVKRLCGVQAQVQGAADLAVGLRLEQPTANGLDEAMASRELMRTWAMRGTLHLLHPEQAGAFLALLADLRTWEKPSWQRSFGVSGAELAALADAVEEVLPGRVLTRAELVEELIVRTGSRHLADQLRSGWGAVLKPLAWRGLLCNGSSTAGRVTFTSPKTWIPGWAGVSSADAAAPTAIRCYLRAYGPATSGAFDSWLTRGMTSKRKLKAWFAELEDLVEIDAEGERLYILAEDADELASTPPAGGVRLLAAFDQYVLGPGTADERIISPARRSRISRPGGWISPVVVSRGRVAGVWSIDDSTVAIDLFAEEEDVPSHLLAAEVDHLAGVLARELRSVVTQSTVAPTGR